MSSETQKVYVYSGTSVFTIVYSAIIILKIVNVDPVGDWPWILICIPLMIYAAILGIILISSCCSLCCVVCSLLSNDENV